MLVIRRFFIVVTLLLLNVIISRGNISSIVRLRRDLQVQQVRPKYSNTQSFPYLKSQNFEQSANFRGEALLGRRDPTNTQGFANLRKHLNEEKDLKKDLLAPNASSGQEQNFTGTQRHSPETHYGGINTEQMYNKENDKMRLLYAFRKNEQEVISFYPGAECNFERLCPWKTDDGFVIADARNGIGPEKDADNKSTGHYLLLHLESSPARQLNVTSPMFSPTSENCRMQLWVYQQDMRHNGTIRIVAKHVNSTEWVINTIPIDNSESWIKYDETVGKITQDFLIFIEVQLSIPASLVALDNIKLIDCFEESDPINSCTPFQYRCSQTNVCINNTRVCDIMHDCEYGDDETQNCDKMPFGSRCTFEQDWCGWYNVEGKALQWTRHNGPTPSNRTGPSYDHTYGNVSGQYMYVNMGSGLRDIGFASTATLNSIVFNPPPTVHGNFSSRYYNSCMVRFYLHQYGSHKSGMMLQVTELRPKENVTKELLWSYSDYGDIWVRKVAILPNLTHRYFLHFDARKGLRYMGDIAIDDVTMSPECFGLNIPARELNHYNYWNPEFDRPVSNKPPKEFENTTDYEFTSCGATGRYGPVQENCTSAYQNTSIKVKVLHAPGLNGIQRWIVPSEGYYTFIVLGASGGKGSGGMGSSRGAMVRTVVELRKGQEIFILVGQEGTSACLKSLGQKRNSSCKSLRNIDSNNLTGVRGVLNMEVGDGGGGGGGGTFVFVHNRSRKAVPLAIAAGGGGLGLGRFVDTGSQHGQAINMSRLPVSGGMYGPRSAGAGGGWEVVPGQSSIDHIGLAGFPLLQGAIGGQACYNSSDGRGDGGFGGGGGGCTAGGGGGGYAGGNAWSTNTTNGEGGYSFLDPSRTIPSLSVAWSGYHAGAGSVIIMPAVVGCECNYMCVSLDVRRSQVACVCPVKDWKLGEDGKSCIRLKPLETYPDWVVVLLFFMLLSVLVAFGFMCFILYNRYQHRTVGMLRRKMMSGPDLQLNRLRVASDNIMTEYNPNYEFGGSICSVKDLKGIPRNQLQLQKALGQGAFGEVYQGFYRQRSGDAVEMPVAVKTLPAMSTQEAEVDFLMEALIMSQFKHPNIVHFIGVCFDKHPRFIVLELLAGGDLKNFLRESRPKPDKNSSLTMRDLVMVAIDVAKGCQYMESHRFIHRDIAARNCLLTTKGPGRVVKIADFGMSRDIYRSDYYRKGGRAMLPIKWMPPEAFLDGIFTSKTDVWSFGVLLWEIMSMGYMPYTGCANRQVMQLVTSGGRLEPPANCPGPIYGMMTQCWHPEPDERPNFNLILERLGYCTQDPDVMNSPLPIFTRPPSQEREQTIMRPGNDDHCIEISKVADYLIPNNTTIIGRPNVIGSTSSVDKLLADNSDSWETSFVISQSKSTQPLLQEIEQIDAGGSGSIEKLLAPEIHKIEKVSPISLPSNVLANHVVKPKLEANSLRAGISLDAGALAKQSMASPTHKKSYANINPDGVTGNGVIPNGPCTLKKDNGYNISNPQSTYLNESLSGISC